MVPGPNEHMQDRYGYQLIELRGLQRAAIGTVWLPVGLGIRRWTKEDPEQLRVNLPPAEASLLVARCSLLVSHVHVHVHAQCPCCPMVVAISGIQIQGHPIKTAGLKWHDR